MARPTPVQARTRYYDRPTAATMRARRAAVAAMADDQGLDALLVFGNQVAGHDLRWLTAWPPGWDSWLVLPGLGTPRLFVPSENHLPTARDLAAGFAEVAWVGPDPALTVAGALREALPQRAGRRVGVIGPAPHAVHARLAPAVAPLELVDASRAFTALRLVKMPEEIEQTRRAAALADRAIRALLAEVRPGLREFELGAILEAAYRRAGGEHGICFLAATSMARPTAVAPAQAWSRRRLRRGDMVLLELSVGLAGSSSQVLRTIAVGSEPPERVRRLHDVADEAFRSIAALVRPGTAADRLLAAAALIDAAGCTVVDDVVHGYGGGYLPPVLRTPATQRRPVPELELAPGMMVVVQPNVVSADGTLGVQTGELLVVTEDASARFHAVPTGMLQA